MLKVSASKVDVLGKSIPMPKVVWVLFTTISIVKEININKEVVRNILVIRTSVKSNSDFGGEASLVKVTKLHRKTYEQE